MDPNANSVNFIVLASQSEDQGEQDQLNLPALNIVRRPPPTRHRSATATRVLPGLAEETSAEEEKTGAVPVLVTDSEFEIVHHTKAVEETRAIVSETEDPVSDISDAAGNITVLYREGQVEPAGRRQEDEGAVTEAVTLGDVEVIEDSQAHQQHDEEERQRPGSSRPDIFGRELEDVITPSQHIGSLQLSGQAMLVPETVDSGDPYIPPSPEAYDEGLTVGNSPEAMESADMSLYEPGAISTLAGSYEMKHGRDTDESSSQSEARNQSMSPAAVEKKDSKTGSSVNASEEELFLRGGISTLRDEADRYGESLHLHFTATESDTAREDHSKQRVSVGDPRRETTVSGIPPQQEFVDLGDSREDQIIVLDESKEDPDMKEESQHLSLRLSPSQSNSTQTSRHSQREKPATQQQSKPGSPQVQTSDSKDGGTESGGFHLSLPRKGTLLHPVSSVSPISSWSPRKQEGKSSQGVSSATQEGSLQKKSTQLRKGQSDSVSQSPSHSFSLNRPEVPDMSGEPLEDVSMGIFRRAKSFRTNRTQPHRYVLSDDSDDENLFGKKTGEKRKDEDDETKRSFSHRSNRDTSDDLQLYKKACIATGTKEGEEIKTLEEGRPCDDLELMEDTEQYQPASYGETCGDQPLVVQLTEQHSERQSTQSRPASGIGGDQPIAAQLTQQSSGKQPRLVSNTPEKKDPFAFHGTQSQKSPDKISGVKEGHLEASVSASRSQPSTISSIIPPQNTTPVSTRKRKRLVHKKSGLKRHEDKAKFTYLTKKPHVSFHKDAKTMSSSASEITAEQESKVKKKKMVSKSPLVRQSTLKEPKKSHGNRVQETTKEANQSVQQRGSEQEDNTQPVSAMEGSRDILSNVGITERLTHCRKTTVTIEKIRKTVVEIVNNGVVVDRTFKEEVIEHQTVSVNFENLQTSSSPGPSPSRSTGTMTSGDFGDVSSSLSRSSSSKASSLEKTVGSFEAEPALAKRSTTIRSIDSPTPGTSKEPEQIYGDKEDFRRPTDYDVATRHIGQSMHEGNLSHENFSPHEPSIIDRTGSAVEGRLSYESLHSDNLFSTSPENLKNDLEKESPRKRLKKRSGKENVGKKPKIDDKNRADIVSRTCESHESPQKKRKSISNSPQQNKGLPLRSTRKSSSKSDISPNIPFQDQEISSSVEEKEEKQKVIKSELRIGSRVVSKWKDGYFYPGIINTIGKKIKVKFDDGDSRVVKVRDVLLVDMLPLGQSVLVQSPDGYFDSGTIVGRSGSGKALNYKIEKSNGLTEKHSCGEVILSEAQAACLKPSACVDLSTSIQKQSNFSEIRLENLVEGKRRSGRGDTTSEQSATVPSPMKTPTRGRKPKLSSVAPMATSTPTMKMKVFAKPRTPTTPTSDVQVPGPSLVGEAMDSPEPLKRQRKARVGLFDASKPCRSNLFHGMVFLLTHINKTPEQTKLEKLQLLDSSLEVSTDDSTVEEPVPPVPFNKEHLKTQIEAGGGMVLQKYDESQVMAARHCFLISDQHQRTVKYFQALAASVPCLSHLWIIDSCKQNKLLDHKSYTLPAGISLDKKSLIECKKDTKCLQGVCIMLFSQNDKFKEEWTRILDIAKCKIFYKLMAHGKGEKNTIDVVVTDVSCTKSLLRKSKQQKIPVVSTEWVIQSLINGYQVGYDTHPRYRHDFHKKE